jgi:hypothetical protein
MEDKVFGLLVKGAAFVAGIVATFLIVFRGIVGFLLASRSDFGVMGAFVVGFFGLLLIVYLVLKFIKFMKNSF